MNQNQICDKIISILDNSKYRLKNNEAKELKLYLGLLNDNIKSSEFISELITSLGKSNNINSNLKKNTIDFLKVNNNDVDNESDIDSDNSSTNDSNDDDNDDDESENDDLNDDPTVIFSRIEKYLSLDDELTDNFDLNSLNDKNFRKDMTKTISYINSKGLLKYENDDFVFDTDKYNLMLHSYNQELYNDILNDYNTNIKPNLDEYYYRSVMYMFLLDKDYDNNHLVCIIGFTYDIKSYYNFVKNETKLKLVGLRRVINDEFMYEYQNYLDTTYKKYPFVVGDNKLGYCFKLNKPFYKQFYNFRRDINEDTIDNIRINKLHDKYPEIKYIEGLIKDNVDKNMINAFINLLIESKESDLKQLKSELEKYRIE